MVDHYADDWSGLWWVRLDGEAHVLTGDPPRGVLDLLSARYPQYRETPPDGPVIDITIHTWRGWSATPDT